MEVVTYKGNRDGSASDGLELDGVYLPLDEPTEVDDDLVKALSRDGVKSAHRFEVGAADGYDSLTAEKLKELLAGRIAAGQEIEIPANAKKADLVRLAQESDEIDDEKAGA